MYMHVHVNICVTERDASFHYKFWVNVWKMYSSERVLQFSSFQSLSCVWLFATPWTSAPQASPSFTVSQSLLRLMSIELMMPSSHLIHCLISFFSCPQSSPASGSFLISRLFESGGQSIGASASVLPVNIQDWFPLGFDLLAVQGNLKSLLQHHNLRASVLRYSVFFMVQLSHRYMTTGKTIALTRWTFVGKVMSLLYNVQSRFFIAFLPRSKSF